MKNHDFKQVMKLIITFFVLSQFGSVETAAVADCPPQQVLHFNPATNKGICCIPVLLPKGFSFKSCTRNGTNDTIEVCPKKPQQLYQWDVTTTASEATCIAEMHCLDVENKMIEKCEENGQNCRNECVCNFPGGYCGTEYFNCNPFPVGCPRDNVQEDCSCRSPGLEPEKRSGKSDLDAPNSFNPITSVSKLPSSTASGVSDKKIEGDQTPDVGVMKEKDNNNDTMSETGQKENLSIGSIIGIVFAVIVVICGLLFVYILWKDRYKQLWGKCKGYNQDSVQRKPVQKVKPFYRNSSEDHDEEAQSLQRQVTGQDEPAGQELVAQPILLDAPPQDGAQTNLFEELQLNLSVDWTTLDSSLFDSHNSMADQQEVLVESGRDQTHVKIVIDSENLIEEEVHHNGAVDNSRLCHVAVEPTLGSQRDGGEEEEL